jgi:hypothetical protein
VPTCRIFSVKTMTSYEIKQLFNQTLLGDYEDESPWDAVSALRNDGNREIFDTAAAWLRDTDPMKRARAAAILAQLRTSDSGKQPGKEQE